MIIDTSHSNFIQSVQPSLLEAINYQLYINKYEFPFQVDELKLSYNQMKFNMNHKLSNYVHNFNYETSSKMLHQAITTEISKNRSLFINGSFHYIRENTKEEVTKHKENVISHLFHLLYTHIEIQSASIGFFDSLPVIRNINNVINLDTLRSFQFQKQYELDSSLLEANIKISQLINISKNIRDNKAKFQLSSYRGRAVCREISGITYNRDSYKEGFKC